jgi:hypothetical protein
MGKNGMTQTFRPKVDGGLIQSFTMIAERGVKSVG